MDPSTEAVTEDGAARMVGAATASTSADDAQTVFEKPKEKRPLDKRKREKNTDASDIDGYLGPWGGFIDEQKVMRPTEVRPRWNL